MKLPANHPRRAKVREHFARMRFQFALKQHLRALPAARFAEAARICGEEGSKRLHAVRGIEQHCWDNLELRLECAIRLVLL